MNCPDCGNPNPSHAVECEYCGRTLVGGGDDAKRRTRLEPGGAAPVAPAAAPDAAKRRTVYDPGAAHGAAEAKSRLVEDPFASPPARRVVYDPHDPFRAAVAPAAPRPEPTVPVASPTLTPPTTPPPAAAPSRHATVLHRSPSAGPAQRLGGVLLALTSPTDPGRLVALSGGRNTIGRDDSNDVRVDDGKVSAQHAFIFLRADGASFIDVSTNGTLVNGAVVHGQQVELHSGAVIRIGETLLVYTSLSPVPDGAWGRA